MAGSSFFALFDDIAMLLDDVAVLSKVAAKKTAGVLGDDLAVNAEQLSGKGIAASREIPVVMQVFKGSLINKIIIVPIVLFLSYFAPWIITPLLILGGAYLCYEGTEKVIEYQAKSKKTEDRKNELRKAIEDPNLDLKEFEKEKIKCAIRMDFILSFEIVLIALSSMANATIEKQIISLSLIALVMTVGVYALVAAIIRLDDWGFALLKNQSESGFNKVKRKLGKFFVGASPKVLKFLTIIGTIAMFLVGAPLVLHGLPAIEMFFAKLSTELNLIHVAIGTSFSVITNMLCGFIIGGLVILMHHGYEFAHKKVIKSDS